MYKIPYVCRIRKQGGVELYSYTFFLMGETPTPSTALKSIISHKGIQMSPAAPFEVFDYYVTRTKGCCWQKLSESKPWGYLSVPRTTPAQHPKGPQSVRSSCFIIFFPSFSSWVLLFLWLFILTVSPHHRDLVSKTACKTPFTTVLLGG